MMRWNANELEYFDVLDGNTQFDIPLPRHYNRYAKGQNKRRGPTKSLLKNNQRSLLDSRSATVGER